MAGLISIHALREEGDTSEHHPEAQVAGNFYPRPPRGGRHTVIIIDIDSHKISIHALREEGDTSTSRQMVDGVLFLSTPSARRATLGPARGQRAFEISIHALRVEGDVVQKGEKSSCRISIHALREEGDGSG